MFEVIALSFPRLVEALRRRGMSRTDAAGLILSARFGQRATAWSVADCQRARTLIRVAFANRVRRLQMEG